MAEEAEQPKDDFKPPKGAGGKNPLLTILVIVNTLLIAGVAYFQWTMFQKQANEPTVKDIVTAEMEKQMGDEGDELTGMAKEEDGKLFPLENFTANLAQGDGPRRFVRMQAVLKFSKDSSEDEFVARKPQIRDSIISTLNSKRPEDLLKLEGKNFLKEEIKSSINSFLVDGKVIDVFYVSFQVN